MGFFGKLRRKAKKKKEEEKRIQPSNDIKDSDSLTKASSSMSSSAHNEKNAKKMKKLGSFRSSDVTMDQLPYLIKDLEVGTDELRSKASPKALKMLLALSEHPESHNRIKMVRHDNGRIISALLNVLCRCNTQKSNEKYMALLVLNNISIPAENKQVCILFYA